MLTYVYWKRKNGYVCIQISIYRQMHTYLLAHVQNISEKIKAENTGGL